MFATETRPRSPSFDEADVSDKPGWVRHFARLTASEVGSIDARFQRRLRSLQAVDENLSALVDTLTELGQLDNTYVVFTTGMPSMVRPPDDVVSGVELPGREAQCIRETAAGPPDATRASIHLFGWVRPGGRWHPTARA